MTGTLRINDCKRYEIVDATGRTCELSSGSVVELLVGEHWIRTRIEHSRDRGGYYAVVAGVRLADGIEARLPER